MVERMSDGRKLLLVLFGNDRAREVGVTTSPAVVRSEGLPLQPDRLELHDLGTGFLQRLHLNGRAAFFKVELAGLEA